MKPLCSYPSLTISFLPNPPEKGFSYQNCGILWKKLLIVSMATKILKTKS